MSFTDILRGTDAFAGLPQQDLAYPSVFWTTSRSLLQRW